MIGICATVRALFIESGTNGRRGLSSLIAIVEVDTFAMALVFACLFGYVPDAVAFDTKKPGQAFGNAFFLCPFAIRPAAVTFSVAHGPETMERIATDLAKTVKRPACRLAAGPH